MSNILLLVDWVERIRTITEEWSNILLDWVERTRTIMEIYYYLVKTVLLIDRERKK